jgi:hypothetical protein
MAMAGEEVFAGDLAASAGLFQELFGVGLGAGHERLPYPFILPAAEKGYSLYCGG